MAKLVLTMTMSLDGFFSGPGGELDWMTQAPDPEFSRDNSSMPVYPGALTIPLRGYPRRCASCAAWPAETGNGGTRQLLI